MKPLITFILLISTQITFGQKTKAEPFEFQIDFAKTRNNILKSGKFIENNEFQTQVINQGSKISLPDPNGNFIEFGVLEVDILSENLKKQYSDIHSYKMVSINDPTIVGSLTISNQTLKASFNLEGGSVIIDELNNQYFSVFDDSKFDGIKCNLEENAELIPNNKKLNVHFNGTPKLKIGNLEMLKDS